MPMVLYSFLDAYDLSGKTIIPFCTNEGSGMGRSEEDIRKECPTAKVEKGLAIHGSEVRKAVNDIAEWAEGK
jgi:flavodoxin